MNLFINIPLKRYVAGQELSIAVAFSNFSSSQNSFFDVSSISSFHHLHLLSH
jgi:hypothetical protein